MRQIPGAEASHQTSEPDLTDEVVTEQLGRIFASPAFRTSENRRAFLRYVVEETLAGRADRIKGYTVAVEVFGRPESFDPQADPVVRLEARRLRRDLDSYYMEAGSREPVLISIPKGTYVPDFEWRGKPPATEPSPETSDESEPPASNSVPDPARRSYANRLQPARWIALAAGLVALALLGWNLWGRDNSPGRTVHGPAVGVVPFAALGTSVDSRFLAAGIGETLVADLMRFPGFRIYPLPADVPVSPESAVHDGVVTYVVDGSVLAEADTMRVMARLRDVASGEVLWSQIYDRDLAPDSLINLEGDLAGEIAAALGQPYSAVAGDLVSNKADAAEFSDMQSYICVLRAYVYRRTFSQAAIGPAIACLEAAVRRDPGYGDAWAMLGWLHMDVGRFGQPGDVGEQYSLARQEAEHALKLDPNSTLALGALSAIEFYSGHYDRSFRLARRALELNPNDPESMAQLGWRLSARGDFVSGTPLLEEAVARTVNPPAWYLNMLAMSHYLGGDYASMLVSADRAAASGTSFSYALVAMANAALGSREASQAALQRMAKTGTFGNDPEGFLRMHGAADEVSAALVEGFEGAKRLAADPDAIAGPGETEIDAHEGSAVGQ